MKTEEKLDAIKKISEEKDLIEKYLQRLAINYTMTHRSVTLHTENNSYDFLLPNNVVIDIVEKLNNYYTERKNELMDNAKKLNAMKKINPNQLRAIHALLGDHGLRDDKASIVEAFSGGRTTHSSELTNKEAAALIGHLKSLDQTEVRSNKMRNKILSLAHEMNWTVIGKIDMEHVNNWCIQYGHKKKKLDDYEYNELPMLVSQFEEVYKNHLKN